MATSSLAPIVVRPWRTLGLLSLASVVVTTSFGCSNRRQSMRPVYLSPAPLAPGCPTGVSPSSVDTSPTTIESTGVDSVGPATSVPSSSVPSSAVPSYSRPSASSRPRPVDTPPAVVGPALPAGADEPGMELTPADPDKPSSKVGPQGGSGASTPGSGIPKGASLTPDNANRSRRAATGRLRQASLREQVRPFVNDADNLFAPPKADRPWKYVVLHHSADASGGYATIDREHRKRLGWDGCGYHFVIGNGTDSPDGQIEVAQRWVSQKNGVHCRDGKTPDVNEYGIGVCLVGDLESAPPTEKQIAAAHALVAYLRERYQIPADHTETHAHLASTASTTCPGRLFPSQAILGNASGLAVR